MKNKIKIDMNNLKTVKEYRKELLPLIPKEFFKRNPWRLGYFISYNIIAFLMVYLIAFTDMAWYYDCLAGLVIGNMTGLIGMFMHELYHGTVIKNTKVINFISKYYSFLYFQTPTFWRYSHNKMHHTYAQGFKDPDLYPSYDDWKEKDESKILFKITPGSKTINSYFHLSYAISAYFLFNLFVDRFERKEIWGQLNNKKVNKEFAFALIMHLCYLAFSIYFGFIALYLIPMAVQNYMNMSYDYTNHNLSPRTPEVNDPLVNCLNVSNFKILEFLHMNHGYHIEHHLFPDISYAHYKKLSKIIRNKYPDQYRMKSKFKALKELYTYPRVYKDNVTWINPETKQEYSILDYIAKHG